ncbi:5-(carboxyamino)imidazole ribonucleotide synthase [Moorena sp. SIO3I6]|uniref:5-(carboxyamino)imidazole ribonucleotide synthase n=1 Tax=Moorena sp. SIO3I6 TaxID=2607831 RepID=UPI0025CDBF3B|nr:5-(carboxyamino)imidazole ribonucleotide synthase [Moorena sp. SIO3I6]
MSIKRVGVIGGGQLAWMMAMAAKSLGIRLVVQTPNVTDPAVRVAAETIFAAIDDGIATEQMASRCDVITFENEFINLDALKCLAKRGICFYPRLEALAPLLDKYHQRCYFDRIGLPQPEFISLEGEVGKEELKSLASSRGVAELKYESAIVWFWSSPLNPPTLGDFQSFVPPSEGLLAGGLGGQNHTQNQQRPSRTPINLSQLEFPLVLKARRQGYDGKGTFIIKDSHSLQETWKQLGNQPVVLEEFIPFERELAVMAARSVDGEVVVYPVVETQQQEQVCRRVIAPAQISPDTVAEVNAIAKTLLTSLEVVGVFGIELFLTSNNKVLVNEVSPRTHNSGHYTIDACETSQFEQQLRAVVGLPLGSPQMHCASAVMVNLLGYESSQDDYQQKRQTLASLPGAFVHWYGKTQSRPGRKLGHVTVLSDGNSVQEVIEKVESVWYG